MSLYMIVLDRVPASSLGCYGSWQQATPALDAQAARSLVCDGYFDFEQTPLQLAESDATHIFSFPPEELLDEVTEEDWLIGAGSWLGEAQADVADVPDLLEAFLLEPLVLDEVDLTLRLALHATTVRALDRLAGELREELQPHLRSDDMIIVLGRRGEPAIEREAGLEVQPQVRPELQHLPLMMEMCDPAFRPERLQTALGRADVQQLLQVASRGLRELHEWRHGVATRRLTIHSGESHHILRTAEWLCVLPHDHDALPALYHQPEDPWALLNVARQYPHVVDDFRQWIAR